MSGDGAGELLDKSSKLFDLGRNGLDGGVRSVAREGHLGFARRDPSANFGDLASKIGGTAGEIRDLIAQIGVIRVRVVTALTSINPVSAATAITAASSRANPKVRYRMRPSEPAMSTMQSAMKTPLRRTVVPPLGRSLIATPPDA